MCWGADHDPCATGGTERCAESGQGEGAALPVAELRCGHQHSNSVHGVQRSLLRKACEVEERTVEVRLVSFEGAFFFDADSPKTSCVRSVASARRGVVFGFSNRPDKSPPGRDRGAFDPAAAGIHQKVGAPVGGRGDHRTVQSGAPEVAQEALRGAVGDAHVAAGESGVGGAGERPPERGLAVGDGGEQVGVVGGRFDSVDGIHQREVKSCIFETQSGVVGRGASHPPTGAADISVGVGGNDGGGNVNGHRGGDRPGPERIFDFAVDDDWSIRRCVAVEDSRVDARGEQQCGGSGSDSILREGQGNWESRSLPRSHGDTSEMGQVHGTMVGQQVHDTPVPAAVEGSAYQIFSSSAKAHSDDQSAMRPAFHSERGRPEDGREREVDGGYPSVYEARGHQHVETVPPIWEDALGGGHEGKGGGQRSMVSKMLNQNRHGQLPKFTQLGVDLGDTDDLTAHVKPVKTILRDEIEHLPVKRANLLQRWLRVKKWLTEQPQGVRRGRANEAELRVVDIEQMEAAQHIAEINAKDVMSTCNIFGIPEIFKHRKRIIKHTKWFNEKYGKESLEGLKLLRAKELVHSVYAGRYAISLDFAAWFDQFEYDELVSRWHCFPAFGKWYRLTRLAMGQRIAVDVAHTATEVIASFEMPDGVRCDMYVDNVRFVGNNRENVIDAATMFIERCRKVRATLNEVDMRVNEEGKCVYVSNPDGSPIDARSAATALVHSKGEFLGVEFDYMQKTVKLGPKSVAKLCLLKAAFENEAKPPTHRNFLAMFGVLFFALQVTKGFAPHRYYALREYSETARRIQKDPGLLECAYHCSPSRWKHIVMWIEDVERNDPHPVHDAPLHPSGARYVLVTDAAKSGWGALLLDMTTGMLYTRHGVWNRAWKGREFSSWSEPEAVSRALVYFFPHGTNESIAILSDSSTAVGAFAKGRSMRYEVNRSLQRVHDHFPQFNATLYHIPGKENTYTDAMSRQKRLEPGFLQKATAHVHRLVLGFPLEGGPYKSEIECNDKGFVKDLCDIETPSHAAPNVRVM